MIMLFTFFSVLAVHGQTLNPKVDSFVSTGRSTSTAELCGHLEGATQKASHLILIVSDPKSKGPGRYVVNTTLDGKFCAVIATTVGQAEVSLLNDESHQVSAAHINVDEFNK